MTTTVEGLRRIEEAAIAYAKVRATDSLDRERLRYAFIAGAGCGIKEAEIINDEVLLDASS